MKLFNALTRFDGRIPRSLYWLGVATVVVAFGLGRYLIKSALGVESFAPDTLSVAAALAAVPFTALAV